MLPEDVRRQKPNIFACTDPNQQVMWRGTTNPGNAKNVEYPAKAKIADILTTN